MKAFLYVFLLALVCAAASGDEIPLAGSERNLARAVQDAESIGLAHFLSLGESDLGSLEYFHSSGAELELTRSLAGKRLEPGKYKAYYRIRASSSDGVEASPQLGVEYIIVGQLSGTQFSVTKMLAATAENFRQVQQLESEVGKSRDRAMMERASMSRVGAPPPAEQQELAPPRPVVSQVETLKWKPPYLLLLGAAALGLGAFAWSRYARARQRK
jgi:hypothetical protein